jgi:hypothetical protein
VTFWENLYLSSTYLSQGRDILKNSCDKSITYLSHPP